MVIQYVLYQKWGIGVLLAESCGPLREAVGDSKLAETWRKCQLTLSSLMALSPMVKDCLQVLEAVHYQIQKHNSEQVNSDASRHRV